MRKSPNNTSTSNMLAKTRMFMIIVMCVLVDRILGAIYVVYCLRLFSRIRYIDSTRYKNETIISARGFHIIYIAVQDRSKSSSPRHTPITKTQVSYSF